MANTVVIKHRKQADTNAPTLTQGELASNISDKKFFIGEGAGNVVFADMDYYADVVTNEHTHSNSGILDATTASYTTADETKVDYITVASAIDLADSVLTTDTATTGMGFVIDEDAMGSNSNTKVPTQQSVKAYVDTEVASALTSEMTYKGAYDADTNSPDLDASPSGVAKGDTYTATVAGTFFTTNLEIGDMIIAEVADAATEAEWTVVNKNIDTATLLDRANHTGTQTASTISDFATEVANNETDHSDVLVDGDFDTAGLMATDGAGNYSIDATAYTTNDGTVTAVTGTGVISSTGGATPEISHDNTDGNLHVPATGTGNDGKVLTAGATAGTFTWEVPSAGDVNYGDATANFTGDLQHSGVTVLTGNSTIDGGTF